MESEKCGINFVPLKTAHCTPPKQAQFGSQNQTASETKSTFYSKCTMFTNQRKKRTFSPSAQKFFREAKTQGKGEKDAKGSNEGKEGGRDGGREEGRGGRRKREVKRGGKEREREEKRGKEREGSVCGRCWLCTCSGVIQSGSSFLEVLVDRGPEGVSREF